MKLQIKKLGLCGYQETWQKMRDFSEMRGPEEDDQLWLLQHPPVFTQGVAGKPEHVINPHNIPIVTTDRGGQVTYHGPGQLMLYCLFDLHRLNMGTREFVIRLENVIIELLNSLQINAQGNREAPGVYVNNAKIASIGLRVRKGRAYHGVALNVENDLTPFNYINPCGFKNLSITKINNFCDANIDSISNAIIPFFLEKFSYHEAVYEQVESV